MTLFSLEQNNFFLEHSPPDLASSGGLAKIFSHTPDEARSGGLAKACVPGKNYSVPEKIESLKEMMFS